MSNNKTHVGFIGLGIMGKPMALNIQKAGYNLTVYNRTHGKAGELIQGGAEEADTPAAVAQKSDIIIAIVTDTPDVQEILFGPGGIAEGPTQNKIFIDMSTISPAATQDFAAELKERGMEYLDAPVSGGDIGAINGTLTIMVGGEQGTFEKAEPILETMGKRVTLVGPVGSGQAVKACNQVLCAVNMMAVCEALTLATATGLDLQTLLTVVTGGAANSWALENLGPMIAQGNLDPGFMVKLIQKDLNIVMDAAAKLNVPLPGTALATQNFRAVQANGGAELGTQAMITTYERLANRPILPGSRG